MVFLSLTVLVYECHVSCNSRSLAGLGLKFIGTNYIQLVQMFKTQTQTRYRS